MLRKEKDADFLPWIGVFAALTINKFSNNFITLS